VHLQLLGIGRNGHLAFDEPGTAFESGFHVAELSATTREDARARFLPDEPPRRGCTAGIASILQGRRIVLCAFGRKKAAAVRAMLEGEIGPQCPASAIRRHANALVLLDAEAAAGLARTRGPTVR
jgi:glucosamine-6-phosphate deaminase